MFRWSRKHCRLVGARHSGVHGRARRFRRETAAATPARAVRLEAPAWSLQTSFKVHVRLKLSDESADGTYSTDYASEADSS